MNSIQVKLLYLFLFFFVFLSFSSAQTTMSGGLGLVFSDITNPNSLDRVCSSGSNIQFKDTNKFNYSTVALRLSFQRKVANRFQASYKFRFFINKYSIEYPCCEGDTDCDWVKPKDYSQLISTIHEGSLKFEPFDNILFGPGVYYQMSNLSYYDWYTNPIPFTIPMHQIGATFGTAYTAGKWTFELQYLRSLSGVRYKVEAAEKIDMLEFSATYKFYQFKTRKERRKAKGKKN